MKHLLDSSVWIALFLDFDTQHAQAERLFTRLSGQCIVPYCVVSEVATVLTYKHSKRQADNFLDYLDQSADILIINNEPSEEIAFYRSLNAKISFTDAALLHLAKKLRLKLITFDKQLERLAKK